MFVSTIGIISTHIPGIVGLIVFHVTPTAFPIRNTLVLSLILFCRFDIGGKLFFFVSITEKPNTLKNHYCQNAKRSDRADDRAKIGNCILHKNRRINGGGRCRNWIR